MTCDRNYQVGDNGACIYKHDTIYMQDTMETTSKTFRFPNELLAAAERRAAELGGTLTDLLADILAKELHMPRQSSTELAADVSALIATTFDSHTFPPDVTLRVFRRIRDEAALRRLYESAIQGPGGEPDRRARAAIHRRIGRIVKRRLGARVTGRSAPLDPSVELIESHALLEPA